MAKIRDLERRSEATSIEPNLLSASAGFYSSPWGQHPRLQILTVGELLGGGRIDMPPVRQTSVTYKRAPKALPKSAEQRGMFGPERGDLTARSLRCTVQVFVRAGFSARIIERFLPAETAPRGPAENG